MDCLVRCGSELLRTSQPDRTEVGVAQVRRTLHSQRFSVEHLIFAPLEPRPVLLALARIDNHSSEPCVLDYTELWGVSGSDVQAAPGACVCTTPGGERALADASLVSRAEAPDPLPQAGLALQLRLVVPAEQSRELAFAYAAPEPNQSAGALVQGWRGDARAALERVVAHWLERVGGPEEEAVARYRKILE